MAIWVRCGLRQILLLICDAIRLQEFVEATKENSGLDMGKLGEQPGNRDPTALGEAKTPQGQDVSGGSDLRPFQKVVVST